MDKIRNENGEITTDNTEIQRIIRDYYQQFSSVSQSCPTLQPHELQHARPPCPSPAPRIHPNSCPLSRWCHPIISSSVVPFSSCPQSFPASGLSNSQLFAWGGQSIGVSVSTSVLPMNTQDWSPLGWAGWISLQSKGLLIVFSNTTVQKHQFLGAQLSSQSNSHIHQVGDTIQPSHPLSSPSPPAPNPSQHQSLFKWVNSSHEVAKVLEFQL